MFGTSITLMEFVGQGIGLLGSGLQIASFQMKKNSTLFKFQIFSSLMFTISFIMLGSITAGILNLITLFRGLLMNWGDKGRKWYWMVLLIVGYIAVAVFTYSGFVSILATTAQVIGTIAIWSNDGKIIRRAQLSAVSPLWLVHNIVEVAIGAIICEAFNIISVTVSMIRFRKTGFEK